MLKSLILLHNYLKKGPQDSYTDPSNQAILIDILASITKTWRTIQQAKPVSLKDRKRTVIYTGIIVNYAKYLQDKTAFHIKFQRFFEGNYSLNPYFERLKIKRITVEAGVVKDLLGLLDSLNAIN